MIDIPIGLTEQGSREADILARKLLKSPRASSVFPSPIRPMLAAQTYREACAIGVAGDGRKLSQQAWAILPKIKEVDSFLLEDTARQSSLREVHPEVCFTHWNRGNPMMHGKKTPEGQYARQRLVESHFGEALNHVLANPFGKGYGMDDLLDAFAALWTCERVLEGKAVTLPVRPSKDPMGLVMEMVA